MDVIHMKKLRYLKNGGSFLFLGLYVVVYTACCQPSKGQADMPVEDFSQIEHMCGSMVKLVGYYDYRTLPLLHANRDECFSKSVEYRSAVLLVFGKRGCDAFGAKEIVLGSKLVVEGVVRCYEEDELAVYRFELEQAKVLQVLQIGRVDRSAW